jgi:hypothetical protein
MADNEQSIDAAAARIAALGQTPEPEPSGTPAKSAKPAAAAVVGSEDEDPLGVEGAAGTTEAAEEVDDDVGSAPDGNEEGAEQGEEGDEGGQQDDEQADTSPRSILETATPEELDRELYLPTGPGGELEKVTFRELVRGNLREADYTRKTQQVAQLATYHVQQRDMIETVLPVLIDQIKQGIGERSEEEWSDLFNRDPKEYAIQRDRERINREKLQLAQATQQKFQEEKAAEANYQMQMHAMREANALRTKLRDFKDKEAVSKFVNDVTSYLKKDPDIGATDNDIAAMLDHRIILLAGKAMKYDQMMQRKKAAEGKAAPAKSAAPLKPGVVRSQNVAPQQKQYEKARENLRKTGSIDAAAAAMAARREAAAKQRKR